METDGSPVRSVSAAVRTRRPAHRTGSGLVSRGACAGTDVAAAGYVQASTSPRTSSRRPRQCRSATSRAGRDDSSRCRLLASIFDRYFDIQFLLNCTIITFVLVK